MKTNRLFKIIALISVAFTVNSFAVITGSKHDLSSGSSNTVRSATTGNQTDEICVFCHTPHGSNSAFTGAPLWNKNSTATPSGYVMYGTTIAKTASASEPANASKACLSCHDGVSAINSVVNAPGSGSSFTLVDMNGATAGDAVNMPDGITNIGSINLDGSNAGTVADLSNDHPVSITYTKGLASLKDPAVDATLVGWITPNAGTKISDVLKGAGNDQVECGTCHDPHLGEATTFLRASNTGSALCLSCHAK